MERNANQRRVSAALRARARGPLYLILDDEAEGDAGSY